MTDAQWAVVRPLLPAPGWMRGRGGQPEAYSHRAILDAIGYLVDNGTKWRAMPADFPPSNRVYAFFRRWRDHGMVRKFHDRLRGRVREREGRDAEPTAGVILRRSAADCDPSVHRGPETSCLTVTTKRQRTPALRAPGLRMPFPPRLRPGTPTQDQGWRCGQR